MKHAAIHLSILASYYEVVLPFVFIINSNIILLENIFLPNNVNVELHQ
jgi:hypothetical protein